MIETSARVYLKTCPGTGEPGTVLRIERRGLVVYSKDLDFTGCHMPDALILASEDAGQPSVMVR